MGVDVDLFSDFSRKLSAFHLFLEAMAFSTWTASGLHSETACISSEAVLLVVMRIKELCRQYILRDRAVSFLWKAYNAYACSDCGPVNPCSS